MKSRLTPSLLLSTRKENGPKPLVSVAISTYQRASMLPRLFDALSQQTLPKEDFEVVLVDNGSSSETAESIRRLVPTSGLTIHLLRLDPNMGPAVARNVAWHEAQADVVAFTDDDCAPTPAWLESGLMAVDEHDAVIVGRTLPDPNLPMGPFSRTIHVTDVNWLPTCNVFYKRADLVAVRGFDEAFGEPGGEDTDLAFRVRDACGRAFAFAHNALVFHDVRASRFRDAAKESFRWTGAPRFFRLHPGGRARLHRRIFWKPSHPKVLLALTGMILSTQGLAWLALAFPWIFYRVRVRRPPGSKRRAYASLPGTFVVDTFETIAMIRGSVRHRTFVL